MKTKTKIVSNRCDVKGIKGRETNSPRAIWLLYPNSVCVCERKSIISYIVVIFVFLFYSVCLYNIHFCNDGRYYSIIQSMTGDVAMCDAISKYLCRITMTHKHFSLFRFRMLCAQCMGINLFSTQREYQR